MFEGWLMELITLDTKKSIEVSDKVFNVLYNEGLVHQAVTTCLNNLRSGNSAQKTRAEVRGGGRKPWKQKGTGRERAGSSRSPLWRSGGVIFAAKKRDYSQKINKKMYKHALRSVLSELHRQQSLVVVSDFQCDTHKTKDFIVKMQEFNISNALIIMNEISENTYLAARNLLDFSICDTFCIDPVI